MRTLCRIVLLATAALLLPVTSSAAVATTTKLFNLDDPRLDEVSGIARGIASPGVFYVQNDSGDLPRFFALDASSGRVLATYTVPGARNHDWEDLAVAPDDRGVASVWLADIGDNDARRDSVQLYRVDEPRVDLTRRNVSARTSTPEVWRLRYPSGPVNAESLAVSPHGLAFIVTKAVTGRSAVYAVPRQPAADHVQSMSRIGAIKINPQPSLVPSRLQVAATGASLSADGSTFALRTYTAAFIWRVHGGDLRAALRRAPTTVEIPLQPQGEGVCIVGGNLILDSEQVGSPVYRVPLPGVPSVRPTPVASPSTDPSTASSTPVVPSSHRTEHSDRRGPIAAALAMIAVLGAILLAARRRRTRDFTSRS